MDFEKLLNEHKRALERFVFYRISNKEDAEDILQETYLTAFQKFSTLKSKTQFKSWIIRIAKNKCNDYYRKNSKIPEFAEQDLEQLAGFSNCIGFSEQSLVWDIIRELNDKDREILNLYYFIGYSQDEISKYLNIPLGTVKSRLYNAKARFKEIYPYASKEKVKGDIAMNLPEKMPEYRIIKSDKKPFSTRWEELMGWLIIPKIGEKIKWALYDFPERNQTEYVEMEVTGKALVHGVEGVEIAVKEYNPVAANIIDSDTYAERKFIAQLTDTHCRFLAESHKQNGITKYYTFLDDDEFIKNWGFGEDNCGKETALFAKI
ncbi:MAG: RNA polymerase sigma factor [Eubacterium sp.]